MQVINMVDKGKSKQNLTKLSLEKKYELIVEVEKGKEKSFTAV